MAEQNSEEWNVDKYFEESEPEEHWELRRKFLLVNKDKYPEDYLIALSRVFTNVEFMGCSYNKEVMQTVARMSEGIVESYRQKKKQKLQRTFVKASDAAESRFSGNKQSHSAIGSTQYPTNSSDRNYSTSKPAEKPNYDQVLDKVRSQPGFRGKIVLVKQVEENNPFSIIYRSLQSHTKGIISWVEKQDERNNDNQALYKFGIGEEILCTGYASNEKEAKVTLGQIALEKLQTTCFTLEKKVPIRSGETIEKVAPKTIEESGGGSLLNSDNVGLKLMQKMGWGGRGLGKNEHGREDNIQVNEHVSRTGLGFAVNSINDNKRVREKLEQIIKDYATSKKKKHLVFSTDFTNDERKFLHSKARKYNLKTRSYGNKTNGDRRLVLSRNYTDWEIVEQLLKSGLSDELYDLKLPSSFL